MSYVTKYTGNNVDLKIGRTELGNATKMRMMEDADRAYRELVEIAQLANDLTMEEMVRCQRTLFHKSINKAKVPMA